MLLLGICDDTLSDELHLRKAITDYSIDTIELKIRSFESGEALLNYYFYNNTPLDIIFLSINMNNDGINTARLLRNYDSKCMIIFISSSMDYAFESFEVFPFNYLLKPVTKQSFDYVFKKALDVYKRENNLSIYVKIGTHSRVVFHKDILYIESSAKLVRIHTVSGEVLTFYSKLGDIEEQIDSKSFIRSHKSFLVNMDYIIGISPYNFLLTDSSRVPIHQRHFPSIKDTYYYYVLNRTAKP